MTQAARITFALLVAATFGAFFLAQRLKNEPPVVQNTGRGPLVSGNGDGREDSVTFSFRLREADDVDVTIVNRDGDLVRTIASGQQTAAGQQRRYAWDGRDDRGRTVPDGFYQPRVVLRRQGRSVMISAIRSDTTPTKPAVLSVSPSSARTAEYVPTADGRPVRIRIAAQGREPRVSIWRTDTPQPIRVVTSKKELNPQSAYWEWNGQIDGKPAPEGVYVAVLESRDLAGNVGYSVSVTGPDRAPALQFGRRLPGRAGITVRYLAVQPPSAPVVGGQEVTVGVDARQRSYRWSLRRVGDATTLARSTDATRDPELTFTAPADTGVYLLKVRSGKHVQRVPLVVQRSVPHGRVLVVLPWLRYQGRNRVDDDGDGRANTLPSGVGVRVDRPFAGSGLPQGFAEQDAPLLTYLDRTDRAYDLTTDVALLRGQGPKLEEFGGVILPGDEPWTTGPLGQRLRAAVRAGGTLVSFGTDSLRREVTLDGKRLIRPTVQADEDLFGARLATVAGAAARGSLTVKEDRVDLFRGTAGTFPDVGAREETTGVADGTGVVASAVTEADRAVIVAESFGSGLVIRTGLPDLATRLGSTDSGRDSPYAALVDRTWALAARGRSQR